ncbi:MAG: alpha-L-fucosidase [Pseudobacter sp.]|uniref:alpha-L-fucosidase n=1 Tax=Pseudobacter sp. TaxID=2045420 RepID=UPI003F7DC00B
MAQMDSTELQRWKNLKYSMFIHFGIYSQLGGVWNGQNIDRGLSEQIQAHAGIYSDTYADVAHNFNPYRWDPDSIALLAKAAGMGSIVITSKHHDGFSMFNSANTDFDIIDRTPYKKDILKGLSEACHRHGLKFGLYFSLIDWHYPQAAPISSHNSDIITPEHHEFNKKQITELLTNYGPVSELWFDMGSMTVAQSQEMRTLVHHLQPNCMIGSRIGNNMGDFMVMGDNQEPDYIIGVPWQSPASFFDETWGYRSWQHRTDPQEKMREKLTSLIRVASRGGNFLLNIGPKGDGSVVPYEKDILLGIGDWLQKNHEAIYNTHPDPFFVKFNWGSITSKTDRLYLHVLSLPTGNNIELPGLKGKVTKAYILGEKQSCKTAASASGITVQLPAGFSVAETPKVVVLELPAGYTTPPANILQLDKQTTVLNTHNAFKYFSNSGVDYNARFTSTVRESWTMHAKKAAYYTPELVYTNEETGRTIDLDLNGNSQTITLHEDEPLPLPVNISSLNFGPQYLQGPFYSGPEGTHAGIRDIDISKPWPNHNDRPWQAQPGWKNGVTQWLPADPMRAYYILQNITSPAPQPLLVKITSGDGLMVFLNGQQLFIQMNLTKNDSVEHFILLPLQAGNNQLVVKYFNHQHRQTPLGINYQVPQVFYKKQLPAIKLSKGSYYHVDWKLHAPFSPHDHLGLENLSLRFIQK